MAITVILPKLGNSVESSLIAAWLKQPGDAVAEGEPICSVETDKTTVEVVSTASGVLLAQLVTVGDDVPVQAPIALIGQPGEAAPNVAPSGGALSAASGFAMPQPDAPTQATRPATAANPRASASAISPRARQLARQGGVDPSALQGSGPAGRIIERDVRAAGDGASQAELRVTPVARAMLASGDYLAPQRGSGPGGQITQKDLIPQAVYAPVTGAPLVSAPSASEPGAPIPMTGVRKVIAARMRASLQNSAQLTMNAWADARALRAYRARLKDSAEALGLRDITLNDLVHFTVARTLPAFPACNAMLQDDTITQYQAVHLAFAVDTPRGLLVPVIRDAHALSLRALAAEARALAAGAKAGALSGAQLSGGTFTVSNLGQFGVESFTPILNTPQVAILGVGGIALKPIKSPAGVEHIPHLALSLTIDHQALDGAPAARFLQTLARNLAQIDLLLAG